MATVRGMVTTYDVSENRIDVSDVLAKILLPDTPLLNKIGISNKPVNSTRYEWWDDVRPKLKTTVGSAYLSGAGSLVVADADFLNVGDIIKVEDSIYRISAIDYGTKTLTIVVVASDADHAQGVDVELISNANVEGQDYKDSSIEQKVKRYNVTQIFTDYIKFTGTQLSVKQEVSEDVFLDEVKKKLKKIRIMLERTALLGVRVDPSDNTAPRLMGGIKYFIENENGFTTSAIFDETNFNSFLKELYDRGLEIKEAWMNPATKAYFNALNSDKLVVERADTTAGKLIKRYLSDYGDVEIMTSPHIPAGQIYVFDRNAITVKPLAGRRVAYEPLAKTGDSVKGQIVGEYTLEFRLPNICGIFNVV